MSKRFIFTPDHEVVIARAMLELVSEYGADKTFCPTEVARRVGGASWRSLMPYLRSISVRMANKGLVGIYFKGEPTDPNNFSGIYRLGIPLSDESKDHSSLNTFLNNQKEHIS